ncbi:MAG: LCP family protein [Synergistetes bacterium]|nr:LCP family protein [Synergistota bacterium]
MMVVRFLGESKVMFIILAIMGIVIGGGIRFYSLLNPDVDVVRASLVNEKDEFLNVLFVGIDSVEGSHRADVIMLITFDLKGKRVRVLSIPRDTRVRIPNRGWTKINHAYAYGGIDLLKETLREFIGLDVDHYITLDYKGFVRLVDLIGGVELYVEKNMRYKDKWAGFYINLNKGYQKLDGEKALQYVRFRNDPEGDIGRIRRQKKFLEAVFNKLSKEEVVKKLPSLALEAIKFVKTDFTPEQIFYLLSLFKNISLNQIKWFMVPGKPDLIDGVSYWLPDLDRLNLVLKSSFKEDRFVFEDERTITVEVLNGNGVYGGAASVARILEGYGYRIVRIGNADRFDYSITRVIDNTGEKVAIARKITEILGYGVFSSERKESQADITIILGKDMRR